jgi:hypothetical protein
MITKPAPEAVPDFYKGYVNECSEDDLINSLEAGLSEAMGLISAITPDKENHCYADGKWTVKEVIAHIIDTERVFAYRALRFARKDDTPLSGFKENYYTPNSNAPARSLKSLGSEFENLRKSNIELFKGMTDDMLDFIGTANDNKMTAKAVGWMMAGHAKHHCKVLKEKYLT